MLSVENFLQSCKLINLTFDTFQTTFILFELELKSSEKVYSYLLSSLNCQLSFVKNNEEEITVKFPGDKGNI